MNRSISAALAVLPFLASCEIDSIAEPAIVIPDAPCTVIHYAYGSIASPTVLKLWVAEDSATVVRALGTSGPDDHNMQFVGDETYVARLNGEVMAVEGCPL